MPPRLDRQWRCNLIDLLTAVAKKEEVELESLQGSVTISHKASKPFPLETILAPILQGHCSGLATFQDLRSSL